MASNRGGVRPNSGRPRNDNNIAVTIRLTQSNKDWLDNQANKTQYINDLIEIDKIQHLR